MEALLSKILKLNPSLLTNLENKGDTLIYDFLREIIVLFFVLDYLSTKQINKFSSVEIQDEIFNSLIRNFDKLPERYWNNYGNTNKMIIKQKLINITTSNALHKNGLRTREELIYDKNSYRLSDPIIRDLGVLNSISDNKLNLNISFSLYYKFHNLLAKLVYQDSKICHFCKKVIFSLALPIVLVKEKYHDPLDFISYVCSECLKDDKEY